MSVQVTTSDEAAAHVGYGSFSTDSGGIAGGSMSAFL